MGRAEAAVEVQEGAEGDGLVVVEVGAGQIAVQVGDEDLGVLGGAETGEGEAVAPARVRHRALQQQLPDAGPVRGPPGYADQPGGCEPGPPAVGEQQAQIGVRDRRGVDEEWVQKPPAGGALEPQEPTVHQLPVPADAPPVGARLDVSA